MSSKFYFIFPIGYALSFIYFPSGGPGVSPRHRHSQVRGSPGSPAGALRSPPGPCFPAGGNFALRRLRQLSAPCFVAAPRLTCWDPAHGRPGVQEGFQGMFLGRLFLELFFLNLLSWPKFCSTPSSCLGFCEPQSLTPQHSWVGGPLPALWFGVCLQAEKLELLRASLPPFFLFLFLFGFTVLPVVQSLKIIVSYILYGFLIVYCGRVNVVYVISSCQKEKSHLAFDYWSLSCGYMVFIIVI